MGDSKGELGLHYFGAAFWQIGNAWKRRAVAVLRPQNITVVQFMVLRAVESIRMRQRIVSQVEIAAELHANPMVVSSVIRSLKKQRLVSVKIHPKDSRAKRVDLTPIGEENLKISHELIVEMESVFFQVIPSDDTDFNRQLTSLARAHPFTLDA